MPKATHKLSGREFAGALQMECNKKCAALIDLEDTARLLRKEIKRIRAVINQNKFDPKDPYRYLGRDMVKCARFYILEVLKGQPVTAEALEKELLNGHAGAGKASPRSQVRRMLAAARGSSLEIKNGKWTAIL